MFLWGEQNYEFTRCRCIGTNRLVGRLGETPYSQYWCQWLVLRMKDRNTIASTLHQISSTWVSWWKRWLVLSPLFILLRIVITCGRTITLYIHTYIADTQAQISLSSCWSGRRNVFFHICCRCPILRVRDQNTIATTPPALLHISLWVSRRKGWFFSPLHQSCHIVMNSWHQLIKIV